MGIFHYHLIFLQVTKVDWLTGWLIGWLIGGWLVSWLVDGWLVFWCLLMLFVLFFSPICSLLRSDSLLTSAYCTLESINGLMAGL